MAVTRRADVYIRGDKIYVVALAVTRRWITIKTGNVRALPLGVEPQVLGAAVLAALEDYAADQPELTDRRRHSQPMLRALGFTSLHRFERGSKNVAVQVENDEAIVIPTKPYGRGGYLGLTKQDYPDCGIVRSRLHPAALGDAIISRIPISVPHPE
jgi:hypothetical protein